MNPQIIDRLAEESSNLKPIELIGCLQNCRSAGRFSWGECTPSYPIPSGATKIERIHRQRISDVNYDIIRIERKDGSFVLYIGHWNDGVV